jgi:polynucleotide 5'-hydroxyl-kinase GRC3/NOL9
VNRYLTGLGKTAPSAAAACLLDLNPYKQEYAPAGQISLVLVRDVNLGPSFTHPAVLQQQGNSSGDELVRAHPIPADLANYMKYFESCIEDLFLTFKNLQARDKSLPLIIDTSGLLYTVAFDILTKLLTQAKAHHIVHFGDVCALDTDGATRLHTLQTVAAQFRGTVHDITAQYPVSTPMRDESELRTMQLQSYFHLKFGSTIPGASQRFDWTQKSLSHAIPWEFSYQDTPERTQDFVGFAMYTEPIEPASLPHALVGSIVQIIQSTSSVIPSPYTTLPRTSRYKLPYLPRDEGLGMVAPLDPRTSSFICTAIIREFDPGRKVVRLLLPSTCDSLLRSLSAERTVLVGGCCDMPEWFLLEDAYMRDEGLAGDDSSPNGTPGHESHWVEKRSEAKSIGYLDTVRRVRKFQS